MIAHSVPKAWLDEAGVADFAPTRDAFRASGDHVIIPIADIQPPRRSEGVVLDENGFGKDRMMKILIGIREDHEIPPIFVEVDHTSFVYAEASTASTRRSRAASLRSPPRL